MSPIPSHIAPWWDHLLDLLLIQPNQRSVTFNNLALVLDAGDDFALDFQRWQGNSYVILKGEATTLAPA